MKVIVRQFSDKGYWASLIENVINFTATEIAKNKANINNLSDECLGFGTDEGRSKMRYTLRKAEFRESKGSRTQPAQQV